MSEVGRAKSASSTKIDFHVVVMPWLAFGHLIPFLDLSIALAKSGIHIAYISTPRNILRLPKVPPHLSPFIHFVSIPLPTLHSNPLPQDAEATVDIPPHRMGCLKMACDLLEEPVRKFIAHNQPDWIVLDFFYHWMVDVAQEFNIPVLQFSITTASSLAFCTAPGGQRKTVPRDLTVPPDWFDFPSQVAFRAHEVNAFENVYSGLDATGISSVERVTKVEEGSRAIAVRSSMEFERDYFKFFIKHKSPKPVFPLGFLTQKNCMEQVEKLSGNGNDMFDWLDKQKPKSVMFVGFGSECKLKKDEIFEIAHGVELSGVRFLWALRKPDWASDMDDALPPGFAARVKGNGKGMVEFGWVPQRQILGHPSIGGSLFHAGWASIVETMVHGHCLVLLPFVIAQPLDARLMVEKGLAIEVKKDVDGRFTRHDIADAVHRAMVSEEGEAMRKCAEDASGAMFGNQKLNDEYIDKLVKYMKVEAC